MRIVSMGLLLISLMGLAACHSLKPVYVLDQAELVKVKAGETVTAKFDGWLVSERAVNRVMDAKIKDITK